MLLLTSISYAQSYTEKYSTFNNRYEYFNSQGTMVGYKYYDSFNNNWVYKDLTEKPKSTYIEPINTKLVQRTLTSLDSRYDDNVRKVKNAIDDIENEVNKLPNSKNIIYRFKNETLKTVNSTKMDYSRSSTANTVIDFMYSEINKIIKEEQKETKPEIPEKDEVLAFMQYQGGYKSIVREYELKNNKWVVTKIDTENYFYYNGNIIYFKRENSKWNYRDLKFIQYDSNNKTYLFNSPYGAVHIDENFTEATLFDTPIKKYVFTIGNYNEKIKPE